MLPQRLFATLAIAASAAANIVMDGQVRITNYPNTQIDASAYSFTTYEANATEISYKGRWDSKKISWFEGSLADWRQRWSAPGLVVGYTGETVAITFGNATNTSTLVGYRINGLDWMFTNVTAGATHLLVSNATSGANLTYPISPSTFELRVTNWAYGVQIDKVHVASGESLVKITPYGRSIEFIGDSLTAGMYTSYEGLSGFAYGTGAGLGNTEYSVPAYPGICVTDQFCFDNARGQAHQWFYTSDTSYRATEIWGEDPEPWDFSQYQPPDMVVVNLGTNDYGNSIATATYLDAYTKLIEGVHGKYPNATVIVMELWEGFYQYGNTYLQTQLTEYNQGLYNMVQYFNSDEYLSAPLVWDGTTNTTTTLNSTSSPFAYFFNTTGILQNNDIGPLGHPTDVGAVKVASHLLQYIRLTFGWQLEATGPEVQHDTLYWNDETGF